MARLVTAGLLLTVALWALAPVASAAHDAEESHSTEFSEHGDASHDVIWSEHGDESHSDVFSEHGEASHSTPTYTPFSQG